MRTAGHTIQQARRETRGYVDRTLECSCGRVFASIRCKPEHEKEIAKAVFDQGYDGAAQHIARVETLINTLKAKEPCAA